MNDYLKHFLKSGGGQFHKTAFVSGPAFFGKAHAEQGGENRTLRQAFTMPLLSTCNPLKVSIGRANAPEDAWVQAPM